MAAIKLKDLICDLINIILAAGLFIICLPVFLLACILVKIDSRGPLFYAQERYTKNKKVFNIYKFRTMKQGTEQDNCPIWGDEDDSRSSAIGKFLRVSHIDELPQLLNVLKGEMALVGPRPERPYFAEKFKCSIADYESRYKVKPGITGWSQINGWRGNSSLKKRTELDIYYINNRSLVFDLKILLMTLFAKPIVSAIKKDLDRKEGYRLTFSQLGVKVFRKKKLFKTPIMNA